MATAGSRSPASCRRTTAAAGATCTGGRHLHWRIVADGHRALVTQTYWKDELGTARERRDPVDRDPEACRWIDFRTDQGAATGQVVFVLRPAD